MRNESYSEKKSKVSFYPATCAPLLLMMKVSDTWLSSPTHTLMPFYFQAISAQQNGIIFSTPCSVSY